MLRKYNGEYKLDRPQRKELVSFFQFKNLLKRVDLMYQLAKFPYSYLL